ncbi:tagatose-bisphosphate aldolase [Candidatus Uhrbacteria bacterium CG10_big_fil_rev_8_21_14_0_10_48_11]|uniref:Tagatose-bisphosphate aldolase n=1 Tax=Candidatus Uhrbacteria bacterium CG10_big_fil_rev_8_21_14_0_10_48_11 TaxID=1975037 RepID=A0A2M8LDH1_9BACT|nr:MAG: tagatose-bisphosphate aldolase [Candidatus Uhrbacteria bacterium CG10_big_fil_rev_8_21_14_0_10_48_11]
MGGMLLRDIFNRAQQEGWAVPHLNISDIVMLRAVVLAAEEVGAPLMVGASEGERKFIGDEVLVAAVAALKAKSSVPLFLNADHTKSVESATAAVDAGFDSVHIDCSTKPFDENVADTKAVVSYAHGKNPDLSVEGEIGYLVTSGSTVYKESFVIPPESLTTPEQATAFYEATQVDRLAPAVGTLHGIAANKPHLDRQRVADLRKALPSVPFVLHGGSGSSEDDIRAVVAAGMTNVHFSTDLRVAYTKALRVTLAEQPDEVVPYKLLGPVLTVVKQTAIDRITLCGVAKRV